MKDEISEEVMEEFEKDIDVEFTTKQMIVITKKIKSAIQKSTQHEQEKWIDFLNFIKEYSRHEFFLIIGNDTIYDTLLKNGLFYNRKTEEIELKERIKHGDK